MGSDLLDSGSRSTVVETFSYVDGEVREFQVSGLFKHAMPPDWHLLVPTETFRELFAPILQGIGDEKGPCLLDVTVDYYGFESDAAGMSDWIEGWDQSKTDKRMMGKTVRHDEDFFTALFLVFEDVKVRPFPNTV